jgi:hypothetical protein
MKKLLALCAILFAVQLSAQDNTPLEAGYSRLLLSEFTTLNVNAPIHLTLIRIAPTATPYIEYNTYGVFDSHFTAEVNREKCLRISERYDPKRNSITSVKLYYNSLSKLSIAKATVEISGTFTGKMLDIEATEGTILRAKLDVFDLMLLVSGNSRLHLTGKSLYQSADIISSEYDGLNLQTTSTTIEASHNGIARVNAHERLEAKSSTGGRITYRSEPQILRATKTIFGNDTLLETAK